jgi:biopolymer transport protein ExbD
MARKRKFSGLDAEEPTLDMSSLIDVSFLLLIYFVATSTLQPAEADIQMTLPTTDQANSSKVPIDEARIQLTGTGIVKYNDDIVDSDPSQRELPGLKVALERYNAVAKSSGDKQPVVILSAEDSAKSQRFLDVLNTLAEVGLTNVTLSGFAAAAGG